MLPPVRIELGTSDILVWWSTSELTVRLINTFTSPPDTIHLIYVQEAQEVKKTLRSLVNALLILTKSYKSKNQVVHEQRQFKDPLINVY